MMDPKVKNLLYDRPRLYDLVFPDAEKAIETMCRAAFGRYLPAPPTSVLDIGCGTGRHLEVLAATIAECWAWTIWSRTSPTPGRRGRPS